MIITFFYKTENIIADHIYYLLKTTLYGQKAIAIKKDLFYNGYGAMLSNGEIVINNTKNSTDKNYVFCISMVNN